MDDSHYRIVVFLGAGSSRELGLPLTGEILPELLRRLRRGQLFRLDSARRAPLRRLLQEILPGLYQANGRVGLARTKLPSITDVLSLVDHLILTGSAGTRLLTPEVLAQGRRLIEIGIFELLARLDSPEGPSWPGLPPDIATEIELLYKTGLFQRRDDRASSRLERVVDWIEDLRAVHGSVAIISTNYDTEIEQALYRRLGYEAVWKTVDFGLPVREPQSGTIYRRPAGPPRLAVYKLHGSLNWVRCDLCENVYVNPVSVTAYIPFLLDTKDGGSRQPRGRPRLGPYRDLVEHLRRSNATQCHCLYRPLRHLMVAPSFVRDLRDTNLQHVWRSALETLRAAEEWYIAGYSLPAEDIAIRAMFLRALHGRDDQRPPEVTVVQKGRDAYPRYQLLLPMIRHWSERFQTLPGLRQARGRPSGGQVWYWDQGFQAFLRARRVQAPAKLLT